MKVAHHLGARLDVLRAVEYYETKGETLADDFYQEFLSYIDTIVERPESYRVVIRDVRRANLSRFPYHFFFRQTTEGSLRILAVKHDHQHPSFGMNRR